MGNKDTEITRMEVMKQSEVLLGKIEAFAKDRHKKAKDIKFDLDVSSLPKDSKNATEMTQSRAQALHNAINTEVQARLSVMGFDTEENLTVRSQMIYDALKGTIADRIDRLHLDDATGGWSLKSLGLTIGSFADVPFLLPSMSIGKLQYTQSLQIQAGKPSSTQINQKTIKNTNVDPNMLFETPVFGTHGKSYSVEFKNTGINKRDIILPS